MSKTTSPNTKLSDTQRVILNAAAQRADGSLLPFPQSLSIKGAALGKVVQTLCTRRLVEERRSTAGAAEWRRDEERRPLGLFITSAGLLAIGLDDAQNTKPSQAASAMTRPRKTEAAKPRGNKKKAMSTGTKQHSAPQSKQDTVIRMLRRRSGVTVEEIIAETGWQPHSVRGFLSGLVKKKLKLPLVSDVDKDGVRRYHIALLKSAKA